jgi:hypothetical protein
MDQTDISFTTISTYGSIGCYLFILDGLLENKPFSYLDHHSWSPSEDTATPPSVLLTRLLSGLAKSLSKRIKNLPGLGKTDGVVQSLTSLSLFVGGGNQQDDDAIRDAFALLQRVECPQVAMPNNEMGRDNVQHLLQQLHRKVTIIEPVSYLLSDELEDMAAEQGQFRT